LVSRSISCGCIGTRKTLLIWFSAPTLRDLRTGSTTPLCRFHVIAGLRSFLLVSSLLPLALLTQ
jgi:hypothetical protein